MNTTPIVKRSHFPLAVCALIGSLGLVIAAQEEFTNDFSTGLDPTYWHVTPPSRFSVVHTNEAVRISAVTGTNDVFLVGGLASALTAYGDFSVSVDFRDARLVWRRTHGPGNQAQLNCFFGNFGTTNNFLLVRSDEYLWRQNVHVWVGGFPAQGGFKLGPHLPTNADSGTLRITRTGGLVRGFFNSTLIAETNNYRMDPAHFTVVLQNNGTRDAVSIVYDNFELVADRIEVGPKLAIESSRPGEMAISWPSWGANWTTNYALESVSERLGTGWNPVTNMPSAVEGQFHITVPALPNGEFFRLRRP